MFRVEDLFLVPTTVVPSYCTVTLKIVDREAKVMVTSTGLQVRSR